MEVLVTGSQGFVGRALVRTLRAKGMGVHTVDMLPGVGSTHVVADLRDRGIADIIPDRLDALVHLAGLTRNEDCLNNAYRCFDANVMATLNLVDAAERRGVKQFVFASTEWVYGEWRDGSPRNEESVVEARALASEYALSKLVSEGNLWQKYQRGFCPTTVLRFGIIYGPRKQNWSAVESIFHTVRTEDEVRVGSRRTARCYVHVEDIVSGIASSLGLDGFHTINLQGARLVTLAEIIEVSGNILGRAPVVVETNPDGYSIRHVQSLSASKLLKWHPQWDLERGLRSLLATDEGAPE